jgi:hypothetical protein
MPLTAAKQDRAVEEMPPTEDISRNKFSLLVVEGS